MNSSSKKYQDNFNKIFGVQKPKKATTAVATKAKDEEPAPTLPISKMGDKKTDLDSDKRQKDRLMKAIREDIATLTARVQAKQSLVNFRSQLTVSL